MKRFTVITTLFIVSLLAVWGTLEAFAASPSGTASGNVLMLAADIKIAPMFDATGAITSDPTGTMLNARNALDTSNQLSPKEQPIYLEGGFWLETGWDGNWRVHR